MLRQWEQEGPWEQGANCEDIGGGPHHLPEAVEGWGLGVVDLGTEEEDWVGEETEEAAWGERAGEEREGLVGGGLAGEG